MNCPASSIAWSAIFCVCAVLPIIVRNFCLNRLSAVLGLKFFAITLNFKSLYRGARGIEPRRLSTLSYFDLPTLRPCLPPLPVFPGCQLSGNLFALFFYHRKDNHPVFIPKRKPQFNGPFHHFHLTDQPYRFFAEIGIVIRMCLANQKIGQVVDNFLLTFTFHFIVQHSHMNIADNPAVPMFLEIFAELILVHRSVQINRMDVIKILCCRGYPRPFHKFLLCHKLTYFIVLFCIFNFERKALIRQYSFYKV
nr:MAG TPA: hypothetical protein [Caudoviricetes sp.]